MQFAPAAKRKRDDDDNLEPLQTDPQAVAAWIAALHEPWSKQIWAQHLVMLTPQELDMMEEATKARSGSTLDNKGVKALECWASYRQIKDVCNATG